MFRNLIWRLAALMFVLAAAPASAALNVLASVPEWAALAKEVGGERVSASSATNALQDPHRVDAKPSLIARARGAQLVIATGAGPEVGWLPVVLRESGNADIQPGQPGYLEAAGLVRRLPHPTDRRATLGGITERGRALADDATERLNAEVFTTPGLSARDVRTLVEVLGRFRQEAGDF